MMQIHQPNPCFAVTHLRKLTVGVLQNMTEHLKKESFSVDHISYVSDPSDYGFWIQSRQVSLDHYRFHFVFVMKIR